MSQEGLGEAGALWCEGQHGVIGGIFKWWTVHSGKDGVLALVTFLWLEAFNGNRILEVTFRCLLLTPLKLDRYPLLFFDSILMFAWNDLAHSFPFEQYIHG